MTALRLDRGMIDEWLEFGFPDVAGLESFVSDQERIFDGALRFREATWADGELVVDLYDNAPEVVDDWEVTTQRSPFPYAQLRLQEHASLQILEERRVGVGVKAGSTRNGLIDGVELPIGHMSGWRVRRSQRGKGYARLLQMIPGPGVSWFPLINYWYVRSGNFASSWIDRVVEEFDDRPDDLGRTTQGLTATVTHVTPTRCETDPRIRLATVDDLKRCVELINHLTDGHDLVRPIDASHLRSHLDDPAWGMKPPFWAEVYSWGDFYVLEDDGQIVACAGLWDRGRHMRDVWVHQTTEETFTVDNTAVIDAGFAPGHADALGGLLCDFASRSVDVERTSMLVSLEFHPEVMNCLAHLDSTEESRALFSMPMMIPGLSFDPPTITKPFTDLAYW